MKTIAHKSPYRDTLAYRELSEVAMGDPNATPMPPRLFDLLVSRYFPTPVQMKALRAWCAAKGAQRVADSGECTPLEARLIVAGAGEWGAVNVTRAMFDVLRHEADVLERGRRAEQRRQRQLQRERPSGTRLIARRAA